jgi:alpha-1,2-mannosyltransferase
VSVPVRRRNVLLASALVAVGYVTCLLLLRLRMVDLQVYRLGGRALLDGAPLYDQVGPYGLQFTYPPFAAILMVPMALPPEVVVYAAWTALSILALALIIDRSAPRVVPLQSLVLFVVVLGVAGAAFDPARHTLVLGQVNLILCAAILLDLARHDGRWRGVAVGVAAGIKLTPLFFLPFLLVTRQWAAARNLLLGFAGTVVVGFSVMPRSSWTYWSEITGDAERIGPPFRFSNQSINGLLHRSSVVPDAWTGPLWLLLSAVVGGAILVLAKHLWEHDQAVTAVSATGVAMTLVSPFSWTHHWVWALPLGLSLISSAGDRFRLDLLAGGFLLVFMVRILWWPRHAEGDEFGWGLASTIFGNAWIIASLTFLALLAVRARSSPVRRRAGASPR